MPNISIIELDNIDSTNNYAMQLVDANKAQHGLTIVAKSQNTGKGQRGRTWVDEPGKSLLMSIVTVPNQVIAKQFEFNAAVAVAIANVLQNFYTQWDLAIKWPNDIIVNDKKAGGILIENILRGQQWTHSVIGFGLNVLQEKFPDGLPFATSLKIETGVAFDLIKLRDSVCENILAAMANPLSTENTFKLYNGYLYKKNCKQRFSNQTGTWEGTILNVHPDGTLEVQLEDGTFVRYYHGQVVWDWG